MCVLIIVQSPTIPKHWLFPNVAAEKLGPIYQQKPAQDDRDTYVQGNFHVAKSPQDTLPSVWLSLGENTAEKNKTTYQAGPFL